MWKSLRFDILSMLKDKKFLLAIALFFILSIVFICAFNYSINPLYSNHALLSSPNTSAQYDTTNILNNYVKNVLVSNGGAASPKISLPNPIKAMNFPVLLMIFIGFIAFFKKPNGDAFSTTKSVLSKYFSAVLLTLAVFIVSYFLMSLFSSGFQEFKDAANFVVISSSTFFTSKFSGAFQNMNIPLWQFELLKVLLLILEVLCFNACGLVFGVCAKTHNALLAFVVIMIALPAALNVIGLAVNSSINPYKLTELSEDLVSENSKHLTFMDAVLYFSAFSIIYILSSVGLLMHEKSAKVIGRI